MAKLTKKYLQKLIFETIQNTERNISPGWDENDLPPYATPKEGDGDVSTFYPHHLYKDGSIVYELPFVSESIDDLVLIQDEKLQEFLHSELRGRDIVETENGYSFAGADIHDSLRYNSRAKRENIEESNEQPETERNITSSATLKEVYGDGYISTFYPHHLDKDGDIVYEIPFSVSESGDQIDELALIQDEKLQEFLHSELRGYDIVETKNGYDFVGADIHDSLRHNSRAKRENIEESKEIWQTYDFENIEQLFDYIHESQINGNLDQLKDLWNELTSDQKRQFMRYAYNSNGFEETIEYINKNIISEAKKSKTKKKGKYNPWAVCTSSVGRENKKKYEDCVLSVKKQQGMKEELKPKNFDFSIENEGTIFILYPLTQMAKDWTKENINCEPWQMYGGGVAIDHGYIEDIIDGIEGDGMSIRKSPDISMNEYAQSPLRAHTEEPNVFSKPENNPLYKNARLAENKENKRQHIELRYSPSFKKYIATRVEDGSIIRSYNKFLKPSDHDYKTEYGSSMILPKYIGKVVDDLLSSGFTVSTVGSPEEYETNPENYKNITEQLDTINEEKSQEDIFVHRIHDGSLELSAIVNNQRIHKRYFDYSEDEAKELFRKYIKSLDSNDTINEEDLASKTTPSARQMIQTAYGKGKNFMTPDVIGYGKIDSGDFIYAYETSKDMGKPLFGFTVVKYDKKNGNIEREEDISKAVHSMEELQSEIERLKNLAKSGKEITKEVNRSKWPDDKSPHGTVSTASSFAFTR